MQVHNKKKKFLFYIYIYTGWHKTLEPGNLVPRKSLSTTGNFSSQLLRYLIQAVKNKKPSWHYLDFHSETIKECHYQFKVLSSHISCNLEVSISKFLGASPPNTHLQTYSTSLSPQLKNSIATHARSNNVFLRKSQPKKPSSQEVKYFVQVCIYIYIYIYIYI